MNYEFSSNQDRITKLLRLNSFYSKKLNKEILKNAKLIMMAPPNMTGAVHLGHIWDIIIPDFYTRYLYLKSENVLFIPGRDHAGIATQVKVEQYLRNNKINIEELSDQKKILVANAMVNKNALQAEKVWDIFAISCNKEYTTYTLDPKSIDFTLSLFIKYFNKGLIYIDNRIVNWDLKLQTVISNEEIIRKNEKTYLYYVKYPIKNSNKYIVVATTRPETIFSDVCLFVSKKKNDFDSIVVLNPLTNKELKIYQDNYVDDSFGSGILKCTPHHDKNDFQLYKKHKLELGLPSINKYGKTTKNTFCPNLSIKEAQNLVVQYLKKHNLLEKIDEIISERQYSSRSNSIIEPLISKQWFFKVSKFWNEAFYSFLKNSKFVPSYFHDKLIKWGEGLEDWCISRQLWWGIKLPIFISKENKYIASLKNPDKNKWVQINDVLDTWFTSGHWPLILQNKIQIKTNKSFYLVGMGTDIFYAWAIRMILTQYINNNSSPFKFCLFHGLLRDNLGRKMSKSLDNGIDPLEESKKVSVDAIRWAILSRNNYGYDINYNKNMINEAHALIKKITSIISFIEKKINNTKDVIIQKENIVFNLFKQSLIYDIYNCFWDLDDLVSKHMLNVYCLKIRKFIIEKISSFYIDFLKYTTFSKSQYLIIINLLLTFFQLLEPIMPIFYYYLKEYIEKYIWIQYDKQDCQKSFINIKNFSFNNYIANKKNYELMNLLFEIKKSLRSITKSHLVIKSVSIKGDEIFDLKVIKTYLGIKKDNLEESKISINKTIMFLSKLAKLSISIENQNNFISKQIVLLNKEIKRSVSLLNNKNFIFKAPKDLVKKEKRKLESNKKTIKEFKKILISSKNNTS